MDLTTLTDQQIVKAILDRDTFVTKEFLYKKCYPLFKAIHNKYYTDCETATELINEIYAYILWPHKDTGISKLQSFGFRCSLTLWLKILSENYCRQLFKKRIEFSDNANDRNNIDEDSLVENTRKLNMHDLNKVLSNMPNQRYRRLIELRYVAEKTNDETALAMELSMPNYYNTHKRAKEQYLETLSKEGLL
ncbi:MAG: sigma-70 family RNA polymerase sigma factor [Bacteroidales bacterium]|nr:sigma-70 family RNA polymerase sigma factor [Bacteroidales bacterium]